jgi:hypothetical protein
MSLYKLGDIVTDIQYQYRLNSSAILRYSRNVKSIKDYVCIHDLSKSIYPMEGINKELHSEELVQYRVVGKLVNVETFSLPKTASPITLVLIPTSDIDYLGTVLYYRIKGSIELEKKFVGIISKPSGKELNIFAHSNMFNKENIHHGN